MNTWFTLGFIVVVHVPWSILPLISLCSCALIMFSNFSMKLAINDILGDRFTLPQLQDFSWKNGKCYAYDFFTYFKNYHGSGGPKELSFDLFLKGAKWKLLVLGGFNAYIRKLWLSFHKVFDSNILLTSCRYQSFDYKCPGYP